MEQKNTSILLNSILIVYSVISQILISTNMLRYTEFISASVILIITFVASLIYGYRKDNKTILKTNILYRTIFLVILFFSIIYALGLVIGFKQNAYSLKLSILINNIFAPIIIIICTEMYRYIMVNNTNKKNIIYNTTAALIIFEILINIRFISLLNIASAFKVITMSIIPIISKNIVMTLLVKNGGLRSTLIYRLAMDTYFYIIPIIPNFNDYITSMIGICFPILLYINIIELVDEEYYADKIEPMKSNYSAVDITIIITIICFIALISGFFPLTIMGVGSNSMYPKIEKGDAIIYKKVKKSELKIGDILVYENKKKNKIIIHRIVEINKNNNKTYYITKGDANKSKDDINIEYKNIKGIVKFRIKYIAKPSVYLSELLNKRS